MSGSTYAVILAGGKGERFWPLSTAKRPKQLLSLVGDKPLLAQAVERLEGLIPPSRIFVVTNRDLVDASRAAAPMLPPAQVIGEPMGRDTAAAVALAAALVKARDPKGVFCILTADHVISDLAIFRRTLEASLQLAAREPVLVTIGMKPTEPSTAYGYIEAGEEHSAIEKIHFLRALRFVEKPDAPKAQEYLASGRYFWNSGMFVWSVATLEAAFARHRPVLKGLLDDAARAVAQGRLDVYLDGAYPKLDRISIDYALMEKADNIVMARGEFSWDDVGSWTALENHFPRDAQGNIAAGDVAAHDSSGNIVVSHERLTALIGVKDLVVVQAEHVTLVCSRERAQDIKKLLEQLRAGGRHERLL
jgi:mannose-1-phosphate guanylyltransferase